MGEPERIERADDPRTADYRNIREAQLARARGVFIAEGTEVVRTLVMRSRFPVRSILIAERHLEPMADVLQRASCPIYVAPQAVLNELAGFDIHRGCLAAGERAAIPSAPELLDALDAPSPRVELILVLEAISNHDNIGSLFRNAAAFGARAVLLDPRSADPLYRKAIRVSMGAALTVPFARLDPWPDALDALARRGWAIWSLTPREPARSLDDVASGTLPLPPKIALLAGAEGEGLSAEALARAAQLIRIPMVEGFDSLNVATAAAIALYALRAARS